MNAERLGRLTRMLRVRRRLTQAELGHRAGVSRQAVSLLETGHAERLRLRVVLAIVAALGARMDARLLWNGAELDRLMDADHAALVSWIKGRLQRWGWATRVEVSFNRYGERGRIDLLGFHVATGTLLVVEVKTALVDVQDLLGRLDMKARLAPSIADRFGWHASAVVPAIVFAEDDTTRRRLVRLSPLFDAYPMRGRSATSWLRRASRPAPIGLLFLTAAAGLESPLTGRLRVRVRRVA